MPLRERDGRQDGMKQLQYLLAGWPRGSRMMCRGIRGVVWLESGGALKPEAAVTLRVQPERAWLTPALYYYVRKLLDPDHQPRAVTRIQATK